MAVDGGSVQSAGQARPLYRRSHVRRSIPTALCLLIATSPLSVTAAEEDTAPPNPRSPMVAVVLGTAAILAPMYGAKAIEHYSKGPGNHPVSSGLIIGGIAVGPSLGYLYGRSYGYAAGAAAIKVALVAGALAVDNATLPPDKGHAYLSVFAVSAVAVWSIVDLVRLPGVVRGQNQRLAVTAAPMLHRGGGGLALAGSF